jgi:hypothetical protein
VVRQATRKFDRRFESRFQALLARQRECAKWNDYDGFHALDEELHRTISECSGTPRVWRIIISAKAQLDRVRRLGIRAPGQFQQILQQHESIVVAMKSGDEARRERAASAPQRGFHVDPFAAGREFSLLRVGRVRAFRQSPVVASGEPATRRSGEDEKEGKFGRIGPKLMIKGAGARLADRVRRGEARG